MGEGLRYENAAFPILSFRAKARNLFRSRSGKGCEDSGEREAPCSQRIGRTVFHADGFTKENGNGKRKRSLGCARDDETRERLFPFLFNLLRKPTPPRCARQPLPREGARVDTPSFLPMEGGAPKGRRLDGDSGVKKSEEMRLKSTIYESILSTADAVHLPQGGRLRYESSAIPISSERIHACVEKQYPRHSLPRVGKVASGASRIGF